MRQIALLALLLAFAAAVYGQENILEKGLEGRSAADVISRRYVTPLRLVALPGELTAGVENPEALLWNFDGQLTTGTPDVCRLSTRDGRSASVLLDFGKELCGGIALSAAIRADQRALKVRIRLGESVSEAMSDVGGDAPMASATNEHSLRDFTLGVPWLGNVEAGNSGFRFVRIDLVEPDAELNLKAVRAILRYRDVPYLGSFRCDDERLNRIWETGAYTVHLNMQEYLWDGVKRDRLVWLGDMHPEGMTVQSVFGGNEVVRRSLDHVRDNTPLPGWMNWIAAYSMWWVIIHRDLYMYEGDLNYLGEQQEYMRSLLRVLASQMDGDRENLQGGQRLLPMAQLLVADGQLVQRHQGGLLLPGKPGVGLFIASGFDPRRRGVVANRPQGAFIQQILRQPPPHPIVALHVGQILPVAIGVAEKELRFQHEPHRALPAGKVVGGLQGVHGGGIAARVVVGNAQHQVGVCVGHEPHGLGLLPL